MKVLNSCEKCCKVEYETLPVDMARRKQHQASHEEHRKAVTPAVIDECHGVAADPRAELAAMALNAILSIRDQRSVAGKSESMTTPVESSTQHSPALRSRSEPAGGYCGEKNTGKDAAAAGSPTCSAQDAADEFLIVRRRVIRSIIYRQPGLLCTPRNFENSRTFWGKIYFWHWGYL